VACHLPAVGLPAFPAICLLIVYMEISSLPLPTSPLCFQWPQLLCYVLVFSSLFIQIFFLWMCPSAQGAMLVYPRGGWGNTAWHLVLTCLVCRMSPKQAWSWYLAAVAAHLFSQCNVAWRAFYGLGVQGAEVLILLVALFLLSVAPTSQQGFWVTELMLSASAP
jgi:hypothetical protein